MISYRDQPETCNSDISNLLVSEELYVATINKTYRKPIYQAMKDGTVAHAYILTREKFYDIYYQQQDALHPKQQEFVDNIISFKDKNGVITKNDVEQIYRDVYSKPKEGDGMILYTKLETHIKGLYEKKQPITAAMIFEAEKRARILSEYPEIEEILQQTNVREAEVYFTIFGCKCKAQIDSHGIFEDKKLVIILDLKIGKDPISKKQLLDLIVERDYVRQTRFYELAIKNSEEVKELYPDIESYEVKKYILHIDPVAARLVEITKEAGESRDEVIKKSVLRIEELKNGAPYRKVDELKI